QGARKFVPGPPPSNPRHAQEDRRRIRWFGPGGGLVSYLRHSHQGTFPLGGTGVAPPLHRPHRAGPRACARPPLRWGRSLDGLGSCLTTTSKSPKIETSRVELVGNVTSSGTISRQLAYVECEGARRQRPARPPWRLMEPNDDLPEVIPVFPLSGAVLLP